MDVLEEHDTDDKLFATMAPQTGRFCCDCILPLRITCAMCDTVLEQTVGRCLRSITSALLHACDMRDFPTTAETMVIQRILKL